MTFNRVQDSWQREEGRRQVYEEIAREQDDQARTADNGQPPRQNRFEQIVSILLHMAPEDRMWVLSELSLPAARN